VERLRVKEDFLSDLLTGDTVWLLTAYEVLDFYTENGM